MYVDNSWLSLDPIYLSLLHPHKFSGNFSDMDGFQDGGYIWAQGVLQYHLIKVPCQNIESGSIFLVHLQSCLNPKFQKIAEPTWWRLLNFPQTLITITHPGIRISPMHIFLPSAFLVSINKSPESISYHLPLDESH